MKQSKTAGYVLGNKIKARRRELRITQEELAEKLDVTYQQVQRYENGMNRLNSDNICRVADALHVAPAYFFESGKTRSVAESQSKYGSDDEAALLRYYRKMKGTAKKTFLAIAKQLSKN